MFYKCGELHQPQLMRSYCPSLPGRRWCHIRTPWDPNPADARDPLVAGPGERLYAVIVKVAILIGVFTYSIIDVGLSLRGAELLGGCARASIILYAKKILFLYHRVYRMITSGICLCIYTKF